VAYPDSTYSADIHPVSCEAPRPRWQEWFSWAFIQSIGSAAGLVVQVPGIDSNKKDVLVETWRPLDGRLRMIGLQLKSTMNPQFVDSNSNVAFDLDRDDYNGMLIRGNVPRFLVVVAVPRPPGALMSLSSDRAPLEAAGWWGEVPGPATSQTTKRVKIPVCQRVDADGLLEMLRRA
jgi:hypothetical protein